MNLNLNGSTALITGASKGIGYAIAEGFAQEGVNLILVARNATPLEKAEQYFRKNYQVNVKSIAADLSDSRSIPALLDEAKEVNILINNAGAIPGGDLETVDERTWRSAWDLKVFGYINMTRAFYTFMKNHKKPGVIINITGLAGIKLDSNYIAGSAGNACLEAFTRAAGAYSIEHGVRIVAVSPGGVKTERIMNMMKNKAASHLGDPEQWQTYLANLPLKRAAEPEEVANLVVFLASEKASYISGVVYPVDGGHNARGGSFT